MITAPLPPLQFRRAPKRVYSVFHWRVRQLLCHSRAGRETRTCEGGLCFKPSFTWNTVETQNPELTWRVTHWLTRAERIAADVQKWLTVYLRRVFVFFNFGIKSSAPCQLMDPLRPLSRCTSRSTRYLFLHNRIKSCCVRKRSSSLQQHVSPPTGPLTERCVTAPPIHL